MGSQCSRQSSRFCWRRIPLEGLQRLRRERMTHPQVMKTNQAQKCCRQLDGALKVHIGRLSAKGMRTNILKWGRRMQISTRAWVSNMQMSTLVLVRPMRISTLVLVGLTQTSTDASHRELNRSFFVNMPPTASMRAVHMEAHSARRFCVQVAENLFLLNQQSVLNPYTECTEAATYAEACTQR